MQAPWANYEGGIVARSGMSVTGIFEREGSSVECAETMKKALKKNAANGN
jgi:hypothetical protein